MNVKNLVVLVFLLFLQNVNANHFKIYGEWACLGSFREKMTIKEFLIKSDEYDYFKKNGSKNFRKFLFFKNHRFIEDGATWEIDARFRFDNNNVTILLPKTYLFYDFEIVYHKGKELIMFDKLTKSYYLLFEK